MPTIAYDFSDAGDFADFVVLEAGNYVFRLKSVDGSQKSKANAPKAIVDLIVVGASEANSWAEGGLVRQHWPTTGGASGRFKAFMAALGIDPKAKGSIKIEKYYEEEVGARVTKVVGKQLDVDGNPVYFNELSQMMPGDQMRKILGLTEAEDDDEEEGEDAEEDEEGDDSEEEAEGDEDGEDDEEEGEEADDEEEEEALTLEDLKAMNLKELKELAAENEVSVKPPKGKKLTSAILIKRLSALIESDDEEGEEDPF